MDKNDLKIDPNPAVYSTLADRVESKLINVFQNSKLKPGDSAVPIYLQYSENQLFQGCLTELP